MLQFKKFNVFKALYYIRKIYSVDDSIHKSFQGVPIQSAKKPCRFFFIFDSSEMLCNVL